MACEPLVTVIRWTGLALAYSILVWILYTPLSVLLSAVNWIACFGLTCQLFSSLFLVNGTAVCLFIYFEF